MFNIDTVTNKLFVKNENKMPILIIEDMSLESINSKIDILVVAPVRVKDSNGSPVTIIAGLN